MLWSFLVPLALIGLMGVLFLPVPVWVSRALRSGQQGLELPPALVSASVAPDLGDDVSRLAQDARILAAVIPETLEVVADVQAAYMALLMLASNRRGDKDHWAWTLIDRYYQSVSDAQRLVGEWRYALGRLPEHERQMLEQRGLPSVKVTGETALALRVGSGLTTAVPRRPELAATRAELMDAFGDVTAFLAAVSRIADPYR